MPNFIAEIDLRDAHTRIDQQWSADHQPQTDNDIQKLKVAKCELTTGDAKWVSPKLNFSQLLSGKIKATTDESKG